MTPDILDAASQHALAEYPRESCGLVVVIKGRARYVACRNLATTPADHFVLSPEDYAAADDAGEVTTVVHSHPDAPAQPSQADLVGCEASGMPWSILSVMPGDGGLVVGDVATIEPSGYQAPLVGREWQHGVLDCWGLCRDWYAREWGLELPDPPRTDGWWNDGRSDLYTDQLAGAGFVQVADGAKGLQVGDLILMQIRSRNLVPNHAAIYIGDGLLLHHMEGRLSSRDMYNGWLQQCTRIVARHQMAPSQQK